MAQLSSEQLAVGLTSTVLLGLMVAWVQLSRRPTLPLRAYAHRRSVRKALLAPEGEALAALSWG